MMLWVILAVLGAVLFMGPKAKAQAAGWLERFIEKWAKFNSLDPALVYGVVMTESSGNPTATNPSDPSSGLMGVTPLIGRAYGGLSGSDLDVLSALLLPENNLKAGCGFLAHLKKLYGNKMPVSTWVQAYNLGQTKFNAGARVPEYSAKVMGFAAQWET